MLIRKGSTNCIAKRSDFDFIYRNKGEFEVRLLEETLYGVHDAEGCASIDVLLSNITDNPITIIAGILNIFNKQGEKLSQHPVYGLDHFIGADFKLGVPPKSEIVGRLFVGFNSSDPLRLNIDEYGISNQDFCFELVLLDARRAEHSTILQNGKVLVTGDFLWKVKHNKGIPHMFRTHRIRSN